MVSRKKKCKKRVYFVCSIYYLFSHYSFVCDSRGLTFIVISYQLGCNIYCYWTLKEATINFGSVIWIIWLQHMKTQWFNFHIQIRTILGPFIKCISTSKEIRRAFLMLKTKNVLFPQDIFVCDVGAMYFHLQRNKRTFFNFKNENVLFP